MPNYEIHGTGKPYNGRVIKLGDKFYTTVGGGIEGDRQLLQVSNNVSTTPIQDAPIVADTVTTFVAGDTSNFGRNTYYYSDGSIVPTGTQLHHHTVPAAGDNNFMTTHNMAAGGAVSVFLTRGQTTRTTTTRQTRTTRQTQQTQQTPPAQTGGGMSGGGMSGGGSGGGGGGGY